MVALDDFVGGLFRKAALLAGMSFAISPSFTEANNVPTPVQDIKEKMQVDAKKVAEKEKEIRDLYKEEFATADIAKLKAFAEKLSMRASEASDRIERYVLLNEKRKVAAKGLDVYNAYEAVRSLDKLYDVKTDVMKDEIFSIAKGAATIPEKKETLAGSMIELAESATREDDYELAAKAIKEVGSLAGKNASLSQKASQLSKDIPEMKRQFEEAKKWEERIKKNPNDIEANFKYGIYRCSKDDWLLGPMYLKDGNDVEMMVIAGVDLRKPKEGQDQYELAERYHAWAQKQKGTIEKKVGQTRARFWYESALEDKNFAGTARDKAEKRVKELGPVASLPKGTIDLLKIIDIKKNAIQGEWTYDGQVLVSPVQPGSRIQIPYEPPTEYDLLITAERLQGSNSFVIGLVADKYRCIVNLDGHAAGDISGLEMVDGKYAKDNETCYKGKVLTNNKASTIVSSVRRNSITVTVDGKKLIEWKGNYDRLSDHPQLPTPEKRALMIAAWDSKYRISKIQLTPLSEGGKYIR